LRSVIGEHDRVWQQCQRFVDRRLVERFGLGDGWWVHPNLRLGNFDFRRRFER
jgi:hypothetical protein